MQIELLQGEQGLELFHKEGNWVLKRNIGYSPVQLLVTSIGACGAYVYESILTKSNIEHRLDTVDISYKVDEDDKAKPLTEVAITFNIWVPEDKKAQVERSLRLVNEYCPVIQSLNPNIGIIKEVNFLEK
ncbi:OsmC family protein [Erysipelothrix sp. HDW6A]|uniref:OsmC family protein n=1 Tax=Erysipelothrix sp. HDW6A TaxID=2714928 RepID=UPI00196B4FB9|nr:OsmC family protein [Erysipelothrix sp. HDW6A]